MDGGQTQAPPGKVVYIIDSGLVTFVKFAGSILAIFLTIALSFFFVDLKQLGKAISETHAESQKLDISIKQAQFELVKQRADLEKQVITIAESVTAARGSAREASESAKGASSSSEDAAAILEKMRNIREAAEQSGRQIEEYRIRFVVPLTDAPQYPQAGPNPIQLDKMVETKLLQVLKTALPAKQYAAVESKIRTVAATGLRRRIFDAKNGFELPGTLVRAEGAPPTSDTLVNEVYDHLGTVHTFFKQVFGRDLSEDAHGLIASVHYDKKYNNIFWNGQQVALGDGDGLIYKEGAFGSLTAIAAEMCHAVIQRTSGLVYVGESGALNQSFSDVFASLVEQWQKQQTFDEASWLILPDVFVGSSSGMALRSLKEPGTAFIAQVSTMQKFQKSNNSVPGDIYINSGIVNTAFYELAKRLKGHAWEKPGKIWYESYLTLTSKSNFQEFADTTVSVATRIYGARSLEREAVVQSWAVVGIAAGRG
jgi:Zn-dependent metalloprotease